MTHISREGNGAFRAGGKPMTQIISMPGYIGGALREDFVLMMQEAKEKKSFDASFRRTEVAAVDHDPLDQIRHNMAYGRRR